MTEEKSLPTLLASLSPKLWPQEYVFCTLPGHYGDFTELAPLASFTEEEGLTLIIRKEVAISHDILFGSVFKMITLTVHTSLDAVGLTAAVSKKLADKGLSANVVAAYHHDHIFVQADKADLAIAGLNEFANE
jgi:hypothetical protein